MACQRGSSVITTVFGVAIFLGFLMLATQVLVHLYTTSTVSHVAFHTARQVAADEVSCATYDYDGKIRGALGGYGSRLSVLTCDDAGGEQVVIRVVGPTPARMVDAFGGGLGIDRIERTARVRVEDFDAGGGGP